MSVQGITIRTSFLPVSKSHTDHIQRTTSMTLLVSSQCVFKVQLFCTCASVYVSIFLTLIDSMRFVISDPTSATLFAPMHIRIVVCTVQHTVFAHHVCFGMDQRGVLEKKIVWLSLVILVVDNRFNTFCLCLLLGFSSAPYFALITNFLAIYLLCCFLYLHFPLSHRSALPIPSPVPSGP